jgi:hypothetical protein
LQGLLFGSYRRYLGPRCVDEGLFHGDDITLDQMNILQKYAAEKYADTATGGTTTLRLLTKSEFLKKFYKAVYKSRCLLSASISRLSFRDLPSMQCPRERASLADFLWDCTITLTAKNKSGEIPFPQE